MSLFWTRPLSCWSSRASPAYPGIASPLKPGNRITKHDRLAAGTCDVSESGKRLLGTLLSRGVRREGRVRISRLAALVTARPACKTVVDIRTGNPVPPRLSCI